MAAKPMFYTVRKHWKKSIFATCVSLYGAYYACGRFREYLVRREICSEAKKIGQQPIAALEKPRRMYVFLNPNANKGGAAKMYERNVAPILHLAAIDVTLIKTDYEGHAKTILGYIDPTIDGIIVAGGDGTLMEVVTGLIRLQDQETISKIPIGVIPLGKTNTFFKKTQKDYMQNARTLGTAAMAIVKGDTKSINVIEISSEGVRPSYALSSLCWGIFQETKRKIDAKKHWWAGPWKKQMAFVLRTVRNWPHLYEASLDISGFEDTMDPLNDEGIGLISKDIENAVSNGEIEEERPAVGMGKGYKAEDQSKKLNLSPQLSGLQVQLNGPGKESKLRIQIWDNDLSRFEFIMNGIDWIENDYGIFKSNKSEIFLADSLRVSPKMNEISWFHIDGEEFEAKDIEIKVHNNKLRFFN